MEIKDLEAARELVLREKLLFAGAELDHPSKIRKAAKGAADLSFMAGARKGGKSALMVACEHGSTKAVKELAQWGGAGEPFANGRTPLMEAASRGDAKSLEILMKLCDPAAMNKFGMDALMFAARQGSLECVEMLLQAQGDAAAKRMDWTGWTALTWAARHGHVPCCERLAPLCRALGQDNYGRSAGKVARQMGHQKAQDALKPFERFEQAMDERGEIGEHCQEAPSATASKPRL